MIILIILIFVAIVGAMIYAVLAVLKTTTPKDIDTTMKADITTAQEFLPFQEIKDGVISMGLHKYRAIVECSSTNYNLKTDKEKEMIEISFQRFLNGLNHPITFFIQTKVMDNSVMLESLRDELVDTVEDYEQLKEYAEIYFNEMINLNKSIGNNTQKKKYIIVPFEDAVSLTNMPEVEKYDYSIKEVYARASILVENLSSIGIKAKILNTKELVEIVYSTYHKDNYTHYENIVSGEQLSLIVESTTDKTKTLTSDAKIDWILYEAQMRIKNELVNSSKESPFRTNCEDCIVEIDKLRDNANAFYKEDIIFEKNTDENIEYEKPNFKKAKKGRD